MKEKGVLKKAVLVSSLVILLTIGVASASLLESYGQTSGTADVKPSPHIKLWWRFNENPGNSVSDTSIHGNSGNLINMGSSNWVEEPDGSGYVLELDRNDYVQGPSLENQLNPENGITVEAWLNPSWRFTNKIKITNKGSSLEDHQVKINLDSSNFDFEDAQDDGADIRFWNETKELNYWIEEWNKTEETATIWVKIPEIPSDGTTIFMYYGNPPVGSASSGEDTFEFFDDFNDDSLDGNKWETNTECPDSEVSETGGKLRVWKRAYPYALQEFDNPVGIEFNVEWGETNEYSWIAGTRFDGDANEDKWYNPMNGISFLQRPNGKWEMRRYVDGERTSYGRTNKNISPETPHEVKLIDGKDSYKTKYYLDGTQLFSETDTTSYDTNYVSPIAGHEEENFYVYADDFRVRKYTSPEPSATVSDKTTIPEGWNHIALVYDGDEWTYFVNGEQESTIGQINTPTIDTYITSNMLDPTIGLGYIGELDEFKVWDMALSQETIQYEFDMLKQNYGVD